MSLRRISLITGALAILGSLALALYEASPRMRLTADLESCGDNVVDGGEECDDGNVANGDGCSSACTVEPGYRCTVQDDGTGGSCETPCGQYDAEEGFYRCYDGNTTNGDGCSDVCNVEPGWACIENHRGGTSFSCHTICGDNIVAGYETCDGTELAGESCPSQGLGFAGTLACNNTCDGFVGSGCFVHGNGVLEEDEACDDGNANNGDGCTGDGDLEAGFTCAGEPSVCQLCGDGVVQGTEECDDGNGSNSDYCTTSCNLNGSCGDGVLQSDVESCDDGNITSGDGCSVGCSIEYGWACSGSPSVCQHCGDGIVQGTEECDDGNGSNLDYCNNGCVLNGSCGDGVLQTDVESCDDGNITSGDGCHSDCTVEAGWSCPAGSPSVCATFCGDGIVVGAEPCDDGNHINSDSCSNSCTSNDCGDGVLNDGEQCDDGGIVTGDGCDNTCHVENGWTCDDAPSRCALNAEQNGSSSEGGGVESSSARSTPAFSGGSRDGSRGTSAPGVLSHTETVNPVPGSSAEWTSADSSTVTHAAAPNAHLATLQDFRAMIGVSPLTRLGTPTDPLAAAAVRRMDRMTMLGEVSRADAIATILQTTGIASQPFHGSPFRDVSPNHPFAVALSTAKQIGLVTGDTDPLTGQPLGKFRPDAPITVLELRILERRLQRLRMATNVSR